MRPIAKRCRIGDYPMEYDLISNLPAHLISCILDRMPMNDAARTSVLSKTWKNIWLCRSHVVLRHQFSDQLVSKEDVISGAVTNILLAHRGPISKFSLFIPQNIILQPYYNYWLTLVSTKGVKHLELDNARPNPIYLLPCCFFSWSELARLLLARYTLDPPPNFEGFRNLTLVHLIHVRFRADMSFGPQLNQLSLIQCFGIRHLGRQFTHDNENLKILELVTCDNLEMWQCIEYGWVFYDDKEPIKECIFNLHRFLSCTLNMTTLILGSFCLFLDPVQTILTGLTTTMEKMKTLVLYGVKFHDLCHISNALCIIRSSPNLQTLKISVEARGRGGPADLKAEQYLESPDCSRKLVLNQLHTLEIAEAVGSRAEFLFLYRLRTSSPSLQRWYWHRFNLQKLGHQTFHIGGEL